MPLSSLQRRVLAAIAAQRDPESYIGGGAALHRQGIRGSSDSDVFHDREEALDRAVAADTEALLARGFELTWERRTPSIYRVRINQGAEVTRLEWVIDLAFRFSPTVPDDEFGFLLHPADIATNKVLAAAGRFETRDAVDVLWMDETLAPLGALAWAAAEKDPGWMPEGIITEIRFKARYQDYQLELVHLLEPMTAAELNRGLYEATARAERLVAALPRGLPYGLLLAQDGSLARPDPDRPETFAGLTVHHGR